MSQAEIKDVLHNCKTIAVVGLSNENTKHSYQVSLYLQQHGYRIVPINPNISEVLGEISYPSLLEVPEEIKKTIDIVDVFRRPQYVMSIVQEIIKLKKQFGKPCVVWLQLGVINSFAATKAIQAGLFVVMDKCLMAEHHRLL